MINISEYTTKTLDDLRKTQERLQDEKPIPYNPVTDEYFERVYHPKEKYKPTIKEFKLAVAKMLDDESNGTYEYTELNKSILAGYCDWMYQLNGRYDPTKGILLIGGYGTGKTTIMKVFSKLSTLSGMRPFRMCYAKVITTRIEETKDDSEMAEYRKGDICFDELGTEKRDSNIWGNKKNLFGDLLEYRYWKGIITHGTTNMQMDQLKTVYGDRVYSRLHSLFNIEHLDGSDYRIKNYRK
jgi:DNA replication protein DnaC